MKSISILSILLSSLFLFHSCKKSEEEIATPAANAPSIFTQPLPAATNSEVEKPAASTNAPTGQPPKLNPPHGQPFHRCEIPVGAPLNGSLAPGAPQTNAPRNFFKTVQTEQPAAATTQTAPTPPPASATKPATPPPTNTNNATASVPKPKLNPAHGQPHHRCDIKVGDPLP